MNKDEHDISALLIALDDFRNYAAAKVEVYEEALMGLRFSPVALRSIHKTDRDRIDEWKSLIRSHAARYPADSPLPLRPE